MAKIVNNENARHTVASHRLASRLAVLNYEINGKARGINPAQLHMLVKSLYEGTGTEFREELVAFVNSATVTEEAVKAVHSWYAWCEAGERYVRPDKRAEKREEPAALFETTRGRQAISVGLNQAAAFGCLLADMGVSGQGIQAVLDGKGGALHKLTDKRKLGLSRSQVYEIFPSLRPEKAEAADTSGHEQKSRGAGRSLAAADPVPQTPAVDRLAIAEVLVAAGVENAFAVARDAVDAMSLAEVLFKAGVEEPFALARQAFGA